MPLRFKDFIALPKPNMYQSLHTTVIGPKAERIEIQIRTEEMHSVAEEGVAAHWRYKEGKDGRPDATTDEQKFSWLRQLMEWQKTLTDPSEFIEAVKVDLFTDEVYVFTPGRRQGHAGRATPVDFAYLVTRRSAITARGAGQWVDRAAALQAAERRHRRDPDQSDPEAEQRLAEVHQDLVGAGQDSQTRCAPSSEKAKALGRDLLEREMRKHDLSYSKVERSGDLVHAANELRVNKLEELLLNVGYGRILPADVVELLLPEEHRRPASEPEAPHSRPAFAAGPPHAGMKSPGIKVAGEDDVLVRFAKCCSPVAGDPGDRRHYTRARRHGARAELLDGAGAAGRAPHRDRVGQRSQDGAAGLGAGGVRRQAGPPGHDVADLQRARHQHLAGHPSRRRGRAGREHVQGQHHGRRSAAEADARAAEDPGRLTPCSACSRWCHYGRVSVAVAPTVNGAFGAACSTGLVAGEGAGRAAAATSAGGPA